MTEMDKLMGDSTINGLRFQFDKRYRVIAKRQMAMIAAGKNPSTVSVEVCGKAGQKFYHDLQFLISSITHDSTDTTNPIRILISSQKCNNALARMLLLAD